MSFKDAIANLQKGKKKGKFPGKGKLPTTPEAIKGKGKKGKLPPKGKGGK